MYTPALDSKMETAEPRPTVIIEPRRGLLHLDLAAIWQHRVLLYFIVWRDLKIRYKQSVIGIGWVVLQPLVTMAIFTVIFGYFAKFPSDGIPYPIFAYCALLPWNYFSGALSRCIASVVGDAPLISKVYFPRLILPLAGTISGLVDFVVSFCLLMGMMIWYEIGITWRVLTLPIPFIVQVWMFVSPVIYPVSMIPEKYRLIYSLNPMAGVIEGFRWALLGKTAPDFSVMAGSALVVLVFFFGGLVFFRNMESTFADVV